MENYEEKYKAALGWMQSLYKGLSGKTKEDAEHYFHELKESEDEKIRKALIERFKFELKGAEEQDAAGCSRQKDIAMFKRGIAWLEKQTKQNYIDADEDWYRFVRWFVKERTDDYTLIPSDDDIHDWGNIILNHARKLLEKQGEQKPAWSEEDERILNKIQDHLREFYVDKKGYPYVAKPDSPEMMEYNWLKSLKYKAQPQPKQEWSEYDKIQLSEAIQMIEANGTWIRSEDAVKKVSNWLKSLKPQNHWKPSEEQMQVLETAIRCRTMPWEKLITLYNDLKKL